MINYHPMGETFPRHCDWWKRSSFRLCHWSQMYLHWGLHRERSWRSIMAALWRFWLIYCGVSNGFISVVTLGNWRVWSHMKGALSATTREWKDRPYKTINCNQNVWFGCSERCCWPSLCDACHRVGFPLCIEYVAQIHHSPKPSSEEKFKKKAEYGVHSMQQLLICQLCEGNPHWCWIESLHPSQIWGWGKRYWQVGWGFRGELEYLREEGWEVLFTTGPLG